MFDSVESTGKEIREFVTGSVRDNAEGKGRWDLMPYYPLLRVAIHFENGAKKYGDRNWEKGQPLNEYLSSAMRHLTRFIDGENGEDHLSAVIWNCMAFIETQKNIETGRFFLDQIDYLMEHLHPEIKGRIRNKLSSNIANSTVDFSKGIEEEDADKIKKEREKIISDILDKECVESSYGSETKMLDKVDRMRETYRNDGNSFKGILYNFSDAIEIGDNVYVRPDAEDHFKGRIAFAPPMKDMVGKVYRVNAIEPQFKGGQNVYQLKSDNDVTWWFTRGSLNKVVEMPI